MVTILTDNPRTDLTGGPGRVCSSFGLPTAKSLFIDGIAMHRPFIPQIFLFYLSIRLFSILFYPSLL